VVGIERKWTKQRKGVASDSAFVTDGETKLTALKAHTLCHFVVVKITLKLSRTLGSLFAVICIFHSKLFFPRFSETFFL